MLQNRCLGKFRKFTDVDAMKGCEKTMFVILKITLIQRFLAKRALLHDVFDSGLPTRFKTNGENMKKWKILGVSCFRYHLNLRA